MKKGFTLVELSIVLVIIGLLIGGILVAQSMISTVKTQRLIRELQQFEISINLFGERFKAMPGDFSRAVELLGSATNGNGDGGVDCCTSQTEYVNAANHMWLSQVIDKEYKSGRGDTVNPAYGFVEIGYNTPETSYKGVGLLLAKSGTTGCNGFAPGGTLNCISIGARTDNSSYGDAMVNFSDVLYGSGLNAIDTLALDTKIDNGRAQTGRMLSDNGYRVSRVNSNTNCISGGNFVTTAASGCRTSWSFQPKF